jgi:hypothetical protein
MVKEYTFCPKCKTLFGANPKQQITEYLPPYFQAWWWLHHGMGMLVTGEFFRMKINRMELSTGKTLEVNLLQSALHQTLREESTFQQDNNLQHKAKSTLDCLPIRQ